MVNERSDQFGAFDSAGSPAGVCPHIPSPSNFRVATFGKSKRPSVLHVNDVAHVAYSICQAMQDHTHWSTANLKLPETFALRGRMLRTLGLASRTVRIPVLTRRTESRFGPSIIHLHWARFSPLMSLGKCPLVVHAHGSDVRNRMDSFIGRIVMRSLHRADAVLAATPDLLQFLPPNAIYCPNPVDLDFFAQDSSAARDEKHGRTVMIHARLTDIKGGRQLLTVARELKRHRDDVELLAFEGGTFDSEAAALGVRMLKPTNRDGVRRALLASDVVIGQLRLGVLGLSELEAMACSRPVIAPITAALYPEFPPIISVGDPFEIADRCLRLLDDEELRSHIGGAGRRYVERHHSAVAVAALLKTLYEGLV